MFNWKSLDFKEKSILFCGLFLIIFSFFPWWFHPVFDAFWIPLIGMYIGPPLNTFKLVNFWYYLFIALTVAGGVLCCYEQKNHKLAFYGAILAAVSSFIFMSIFIANTSDLNNFYFIIDALISYNYTHMEFNTVLNLIATKVFVEIGMYFEMLAGHIVSLNYATQYYFGTLPILFGALAAVVAW